MRFFRRATKEGDGVPGDQVSGPRIELPAGFITEAALSVLQKHYPVLKGSSGSETHPVVLALGDLSEEEQLRLALDLRFFSQNPQLPLENLCNRIDNYFPQNESQYQLLESAKELLDLETPVVAAGLFIWGEAGVGKTHMVVGLTKEFMRRGLKPNSVNASDFSRLTKIQLSPNQGWILDDLNSPYGEGMSAFKKIVLNAHNTGGRVFVTSNIPYEELMEHAFVADPGERTRYLDRTKGMFKILEVKGKSYREGEVWFRR